MISNEPISNTLTPLNFSGKINYNVFIDGNIKNKDANYDEKFWEEVKVYSQENTSYVWSKTKKTGFEEIDQLSAEFEEFLTKKYNGLPFRDHSTRTVSEFIKELSNV